MNRGLLFLTVLLTSLLAVPARAHLGSPNVFFEGRAGQYPVHVVIKPAEVIPGLAEISVRVDGPGVERVTALPIKWNAGRQGAPPPDVARPVRGETNLFSAQLWFMEAGAQSIELEIMGGSGVGRVIIPVDAVATRVLPMPKALGSVLLVLGLGLLALLVSIIGAAVRESVLSPGTQVPLRRRWYARGAMSLGALLLVTLIWGGKRWWEAEAADYRNNRLYQPIAAQATIRNKKEESVLRLEITDPAYSRSAPLVPDHGKLMHLFLVREPALDVFAHLHPEKLDRRAFETVLPQLPAGEYRVYADITHETGFSETLTTRLNVPEISEPGAAAVSKIDPDDSWRVCADTGGCQSAECRLGPDSIMSWIKPSRIAPNEPVTLHFIVHDEAGHSKALETYLGMHGHLALRSADGSVFTHLHPGGSASMAAMQLAVYRIEGKLPLKAAYGADDPICQVPSPTAADQGWVGGNPPSEGVSFPYAFPKPGLYRLWVQVKVAGKILTGVYDAEVGSS